eukprot:1157892-Pelagomonas_calceolata.AAC.8
MASPGHQGPSNFAGPAARHDDESRMVANNTKHVFSSSNAHTNTPSAAHCHPADQSEGEPQSKGAMQHEFAQQHDRSDPQREKEEGELEEEQNEQQLLHGAENGGQVAGSAGDRDRDRGGGSSDGGERGKGKREGKSKRSKEDKKGRQETEEERRARKEERRARREAEGRGHGHKRHKSSTRERDEGEAEAREAVPEGGRGAERKEEVPLEPYPDLPDLRAAAADVEGGDDDGYEYEGRHGRSHGAGRSAGRREEDDKRARLEEGKVGYEVGYEEGYEGQGYGWEEECRHRGSSRHSTRKEDNELVARQQHSRRSSGREDGRREEGSRYTDGGGSSRKRAAELDLGVEEAQVGSGRGPASSAREEREGKRDRVRDDSRLRSSSRREGGDEERERRRGEEMERHSRSHRVEMQQCTCNHQCESVWVQICLQVLAD